MVSAVHAVMIPQSALVRCLSIPVKCRETSRNNASNPVRLSTALRRFQLTIRLPVIQPHDVESQPTRQVPSAHLPGQEKVSEQWILYGNYYSAAYDGR